LKAQRFENSDDFFASFFSKKNEERNNTTVKMKGDFYELKRNWNIHSPRRAWEIKKEINSLV